MSASSLKATLERLGLRQTELAKLIDVSPRTVSLWATGGAPLPGPVEAYLRVIEMLTPQQRREELRRVQGREKMFDEGLYSLRYAGRDGELTSADDALAVLRNGKILGSDRYGGLFTGSYEFDPANETNNMHVRLQIPPDGVLVNGFDAGPEGATIDIVGAFERAAPVSTTTVDIGGRPIDLHLTYLGAIPN